MDGVTCDEKETAALRFELRRQIGYLVGTTEECEKRLRGALNAAEIPADDVGRAWKKGFADAVSQIAQIFHQRDKFRAYLAHAGHRLGAGSYDELLEKLTSEAVEAQKNAAS